MYVPKTQEFRNAGLEEDGNELFKVCAPGQEPEKPGRRVL